jgi:hypothetical protein
MLVIRRSDDGRRSFTAIFLPGEEPRVFPTTDQEHARILQIFKQDRPYADVCNDFTDFGLGPETLPPVAVRRSSS